MSNSIRRVGRYDRGRNALASATCTLALVAACKRPRGDAPAPAVSAPPAVSAASVERAAAELPAAPATTPSALTSAEAAPEKAAATYDVFGVKSGDVLNVRAEPSPFGKKVHSYTPDVRGIVATGESVEKDETPWMKVQFEGGSGWLNRSFVTEHHSGNGCDDPNLTALIRAFMRAVASADGAALRPLVSPVRGLSIRQAHWNPTVIIPLAEVPALFTSPAPRKWGSADGSGEPIVEPFRARMFPLLQRAVSGKGAQEKCGQLLMGSSAGSNEWPPEYAHLTHVSFHQPAPDGTNDWVTWVMGTEYVDAKPYVATLVQYQWEI